ncbi:squalene/phytoene synthase family protein [Hyphococcus flavus]|uniref:Squalene/phytoene synthase family protein n=1 Tax=Hyphococcus flavus TaxID=1866326 RepID=A0AAE9ZCG6_9PROT|nr:squalene/phytoene synthase family protein [Hyphococcus flavus]WDI30905.1 squalene/phytoene synthase family protein [Hyphococcus flavus]
MTAHPAISPEEARQHAFETVKRSKTSFGPGMRILSKPRREGMYAVYAFCREVDDIADEGGTLDQKRKALAGWRAEIDRLYRGVPEYPTGVALLEPVEKFNLPKDEFFLMIEGMEMDAEGPVVAPGLEALFAYTRRVAGAVGQLSMPIFGAPAGKVSDDFAISLGDALQFTNILRDIEQDAGEGRLYLPKELLEKHHCPMTPDEIADAPGLPALREDMAKIAREKFSHARNALKSLDWKILRPALLMMGVYERYLDKMTARGWDNGQPRVTIPNHEKAMIAMRWLAAPKLERQEAHA